MSAPATPILIGIDWGTTSFRAYLLARGGQVLDSVDSADGISAVADGDFERQLLQHIAPWRDRGELPILLSGMITSRNGWLETPYLDAPAGAEELAAALRPVPSSQIANAWFITGVSCRRAGYPDVMRGEETEIIGHIAQAGQRAARYLLPGTHSKWVEVEHGKVTAFTSCMTGDVYAALRHHTILGATMRDDGEICRAAFERGVQTARGDDNLLATVFSARTLALFNQLAPNEGQDYLSGLLIGHEVVRQTGDSREAADITIIGRDSLAERYALALAMIGHRPHKTSSGLVARGHLDIATRAGIIQ